MLGWSGPLGTSSKWYHHLSSNFFTQFAFLTEWWKFHFYTLRPFIFSWCAIKSRWGTEPSDEYGLSSVDRPLKCHLLMPVLSRFDHWMAELCYWMGPLKWRNRRGMINGPSTVTDPKGHVLKCTHSSDGFLQAMWQGMRRDGGSTLNMLYW